MSFIVESIAEWKCPHCLAGTSTLRFRPESREWIHEARTAFNERDYRFAITVCRASAFRQWVKAHWLGRFLK